MMVLGELLLFLVDIYIWIIIAMVIASWLITFEVISTKNKSIANLINLLDRLTTPVMRPVQKYVPSIGGIDISPIIVIFFGWYILKPLIIIIFF